MSDTAAYLKNSDTALVNLSDADFSVAFWFKPTSGPTFTPATILLAPAWFVSLNSDGTLRFSINHSPTSTVTFVDSSESVVGDDWNFVVVVYDTTAATLTISLNGVSTSSAFTADADSSASQYTSSFQISTASLQDGASISAAFDVDAVTVWSRVLTEFEITTLYRSGTGLDYPFMGGPFNLIFQGNLIADLANPLVVASAFELWNIDRSFDGSTNTFQGAMGLLFAGADVSTGYSWFADNFDNKIVFAQHDNVSQYWIPPYPNTARDLPGLPSDDSKWDGVTVFLNHVLLWKEDRLKWSDAFSFSTYIPVGETAVSAVLSLNADFIQPPVGGTVTVSVVNIAAEVVSISLSGDMSFPDTNVGDTEQAILTITNSGTAALEVSGISLPDGFTGNFIGTIPVNGSQPVVITFAPTEAIDYVGQVTVASNATQGTSSLAISGTGIGATKVIALSGTLNFGANVKNKPVASSLIITNNGNTLLTVTSISLPTGYSGSFAGTVAAGASQTVAITFTPTAVQSYNGTITVNSDATAGTSSIAVTGSGVSSLPYGIFLTDNGTCQFGDVPTGTTPTGTLRIYNTGNNSFNVIGITLPGGFSGSFTGSISAHSFHDVTISFSPVDPVPYSGLVTVNTNHGVTGTIVISGRGTETGKIISLSGSLDFGECPVGSSVHSILKIENVGDDALTVSSISYPSGFSGAFSGVINPGQSKNVMVTFSPTTATTYSGTLTVNSDATGGTGTFAVSGVGIAVPTPEVLVKDQFVTITDEQNGLTYYNFYSVVSMTGTSLVLKLLDLTGATPSGLTISSERQIFTLDANEAGEKRTTGANVNGPIFRVVTQGDYAYVFKERSIQSIRYVGQGSGTFAVTAEVTGEGMLARNAITSLNDGPIVFLGHKELFQYQGGPNPVPVCMQYTRQLYRELDRTRLADVILYHNEQRKEVWVQYPKIGGGFRVLIWNYIEDTASLDDYDPEVMFSAFGFADWSTDPTWAQIPESTTWENADPSIEWQDLVNASKDHLTLMGSDDGNLRVWGTRFARDGEAYKSLSETMDFDLGEPDILKYVDVVVLGLQVLQPDDVSRLMYVQIGSRMGLNDTNITWSDPQPVLVNGKAEEPVRVNPGGAGRYLRLRLSSSDVDVQWRISSFEIHARPGGWY